MFEGRQTWEPASPAGSLCLEKEGQFYMRCLAWSFVAMWIACQPAFGASSDGTFKIDGPGTLACSEFVAAVTRNDGQRVAGFSAWTEGFLTGVNAFWDDTYDITPWQTAPIVMEKLRVFCAANPQTSYMDAVGKLVALLSPSRQQMPGDVVQARHGGKAVVLPAVVLDQVRSVLEASRGAPLPTPGGGFDQAFSDALSAYQAAHNLPSTGLPDQLTLNAMFP